MEAESNEHVIRCSECGRGLIVRDTVNNGVAFLSHLKNDHGIYYTAQRMTETRQKTQGEVNKQKLVDSDSHVQPEP